MHLSGTGQVQLLVSQSALDEPVRVGPFFRDVVSIHAVRVHRRIKGQRTVSLI